IGYGQLALTKSSRSEADPAGDLDSPLLTRAPGGRNNVAAGLNHANASGPMPGSLNQVSLSAVDAWQVFQPLLVIYGFDYSRFVGSAARQRESVLPRLAVQF